MWGRFRRRERALTMRDAASTRCLLRGQTCGLSVDAFHFVWKKVSGDVSLTADMAFPSTTGNPNPHRKAVLMFRQTLDADGVYADAAQHGSGMTALQYRRERGATTQDIELNIESPRQIRLEKRGDTITMFLSNHGEPLHQVGASIKLHFDGEFYAGIGVCSHDKDVVETATFSNLKLEDVKAEAESGQPVLYSTLQTIGIEDNFRRAMVVATGPGKMEAPELESGRQDADLQSRRTHLDDSRRGRHRHDSQHGRSDELHGQPWAIAGWQVAGHQLQHAGKAGDPRIHCAFGRWRAEAADGESIVVLS